MNRITKYYIKKIRPLFYSFLTRLIYSSSNLEIGRNFRCDSIPRIILDSTCKLIIGDNVELRRNIEIRVHGNSQVNIGDNIRIDRGVRILAANDSIINIAEGARIGLYSVLNGGDNITIGKKSLISGFVYLQTSMHGFKNREKSVQDQGYLHKPVILGDDTWLGTHSVIMPGVLLGKGVVVGSNSVVTKSIEDYKVVGGVPAKEIKERK